VSLELEHLEAGRFTIDLLPDTPQDIRDALDPRVSRGGHAFALTVVTPQHIPVGAISDADLLSRAMYAGVTYGLGQDRQSVFGYGLLKLLGDDDGGVLWAAANFTDTGLTVNTALDAYVFDGAGAIDRGNGLTQGTTPADATTFSMRLRAGQTPRQNLAWLCARGPGGPYEHRVNPDCSVDVETAANLFRSGQVLLVDEGGPDPSIDGLTADLSLDGIDVENFVSEQYVDWDGDGASMGSATNTVPAGWDAPDGDPIQWRGYQRGTPKTKLRDPDDVDKTFAYINANQAAASVQAARMANQKASHRLNVTAEIDVHHPMRFVVPGDWAYVEDRQLGVYDTTNQIRFRGQTRFPQLLRAVSMEVPCRPEYGYYLRLSDGSLIDFTRYVAPEDNGCVIQLGTRGRFTRRKARKRHVTRHKNRQRARLQVYLNRVP
jgi:hypothetical protein